MGVLERWVEWRTAPAANIEWGRWFGLRTQTHAGVDVSEESSLALPAVWACVNVLAQTVAMLPLHTYRRLPNGGKTRATEHPLYGLLHTAPNPEQTSMEFREMVVGHLATWGNAYVEIDAGPRSGRIRALWPLLPNRMSVERRGGRLRYTYRTDEGPDFAFDETKILHLRGLSGDGIVGYSPIRQAMQAIGLGLAMEEFGARFFGNGARPGLIVRHPGALKDAAYKRLKDSWAEDHQGLSNAHRVKILEEGMDITTIGVPPEEAQFLESRRYQGEEIARIFRMPPHKIGILTDATYSNIEHQSIAFVTDTIMPWLARMEQRYSMDLLSDREREELFVEHMVNGLLRGDVKSRYDVYAIARNWGLMSANDVLSLENMDPIENGDVYLQPLNMVEAGTVGSPQGAPVADPAARAWLDEAMQRVARREVQDLRRLLPKLKRGDVDEFRGAVDGLYRELVPAATEILAGPLRALGMAADGPGSPKADRLGEMAAGYVWRRRAQVEGALHDADAAQAVETLLGEWEASGGSNGTTILPV